MTHVLGFCLFVCCIFYVANLSSSSAPWEEKCRTGLYPPKDESVKVKTVIVNLDAAPLDRWTEVVKGRKDQISNLLNEFKSFIKNWGNWTKEVIQFIDSDLGYLVETLPQPFADEIRGVAKATGLNLGEVVTFNIFYEVFSMCTSIVAQDSSGQLFHARNLDFGLFLGWNAHNHSWPITQALRPLIVNLDFQRNHKTVFKTVQFAGYIGAITAIKPGVFTYSMNERFNIDGGYVGIIEWIFGIRKGVHWVTFLARQVLENATSYDEAKYVLSKTPLLSPAYYILGGNSSGQGCVITRSRADAVDVWELGGSNSSAWKPSGSNSSTWYLLETNYDRWQKPLFVDDRRTPGKRCMNQLQQKNVSFAGLYDVLSTIPVLNKLTTYTALMQVNSGKLETYLQNCDKPNCAPW